MTVEGSYWKDLGSVAYAHIRLARGQSGVGAKQPRL